MKLIFILCFFLVSCSSYYQLNSLGGWSGEPHIDAWKKDTQKATYSIFLECKSFDTPKSSKGLYDCLYNKGYRFKPKLGYCSYWKDTYICQNREKYSN